MRGKIAVAAVSVRVVLTFRSVDAGEDDACDGNPSLKQALDRYLDLSHACDLGPRDEENRIGLLRKDGGVCRGQYRR